MGIAASRGTGELFPQVLPWLVVLLGLVLVASIVLAILRRLARSSGSAEPEGFTLQGLREMHARGELTDAEFERAKAAVIARAKATESVEPGNGSRESPDNRVDSPS